VNTDTILLIGVVGTGLLFDTMNGFHDGCNAVSTVIYTKALKPRTAIGLSAMFNFVGPLVFGIAVAETIGGVIKAADATAHLVIAAFIGALIWDILTWIWALPVSSSHALIGGLLGAGLASLGPSGINWSKVLLVFAALLVSPVLGLAAGYGFMQVTRLIIRRLKLDIDRADKFYRRMQIVSSSWVSLSHGSNDATKVMGIIVIFLAGQQKMNVSAYITQHGMPKWVILSCAAAMALGTYLGYRSFRIIRTVGERLTQLHPVNGFSAEVGGATIIQVASALGLPVSTTHVVTSSVTGTGLASGVGAVSWKVFRAIAMAWVITVPFCAIVAALVYWLLKLVM
jgi:inorganic phosphate transporter, PiT family